MFLHCQLWSLNQFQRRQDLRAPLCCTVLKNGSDGFIGSAGNNSWILWMTISGTLPIEGPERQQDCAYGKAVPASGRVRGCVI
jgi:hypothetical protein